ncbi:rab-GTPase-TBC domain-containing protein [Chaetomium strumarium]|uniref:Rab-GTPase-TBC domain-containing protein n=1 Tax=Chaetomium strumarium TaxID=1170767 RepID=A0AAJ0GV49_9PEZI|nr:rab-GTPase-TBC domain-containing protein [Chaetomium strumarium]
MDGEKGMPSPTDTGSQSMEPSRDKKTANHSNTTSTADKKKEELLEACRRRDLSALRALAESRGGFLADSIRQQAWPILLGLPPGNDVKTEAESPSSSWESLPRHKDEDQVQLDVNRAFIYYPDNQTESQLAHQKSLLSQLIVSVLRQHPYLCYFQGYHDIAQVLLLVLPSSVQLPAVTHLSLSHIRDFMLPSLSPAIAQLRLIPDILRLSDPPLWRHLSHTEPFFALSGTLTMYAHDITSLGEIARLFDVLLAREPVFTVYLFAAIVRSRRDELFDTPPDEPEMLHSILSKLPVPLDLEGLIAAALRLQKEVPPEQLPAWKRISRWSVLKTNHSSNSRGGDGRGGGGGGGEQRVEQWRMYFERQVEELRWEEKKERARKWVWKHRRPARMVALAVLVGVLAVWLRKGPLPGPLVSGMGYLSGLLARWWR